MIRSHIKNLSSNFNMPEQLIAFLYTAYYQGYSQSMRSLPTAGAPQG